jgi:hypothetical protein
MTLARYLQGMEAAIQATKDPEHQRILLDSFRSLLLELRQEHVQAVASIEEGLARVQAQLGASPAKPMRHDALLVSRVRQIVGEMDNSHANYDEDSTLAYLRKYNLLVDAIRPPSKQPMEPTEVDPEKDPKDRIFSSPSRRIL